MTTKKEEREHNCVSSYNYLGFHTDVKKVYLKCLIWKLKFFKVYKKRLKVFYLCFVACVLFYIMVTVLPAWYDRDMINTSTGLVVY